MLDENAIRRPDFQAGFDVVLGDGQTWTFPRPRLSFRPTIVNGKIKIKGASFGPEFDPYYDVIFGVAEHEDWGLQEAKVMIAFMLLRSNYDLPDEAVSDLLSLEPHDSKSVEMWQTIMDVVMGRDPNEDGSDTSEPVS